MIPPFQPGVKPLGLGGTNSADATNVNGTILKGMEFLLHS
jgi:hypothetical protein